jgi:hypothetical protein
VGIARGRGARPAWPGPSGGGKSQGPRAPGRGGIRQRQPTEARAADARTAGVPGPGVVSRHRAQGCGRRGDSEAGRDVTVGAAEDPARILFGADRTSMEPTTPTPPSTSTTRAAPRAPTTATAIPSSPSSSSSSPRSWIAPGAWRSCRRSSASWRTPR